MNPAFISQLAPHLNLVDDLNREALAIEIDIELKIPPEKGFDLEPPPAHIVMST
jgi:hypothetical protein